MSLGRRFDGGDPARNEPVTRTDGTHEERRDARTGLVAHGTLACPSCDAPVATGGRPLGPADELACPYCGTAGPVRGFLSLATPARPHRVAIRIRA
jgi:hypothetical protein